MSLRINELKFGTVREIDGATISVKADHLEKKYQSLDYYVEVGKYVNCGGLHGDTICLVSKVQVEELEKVIITGETKSVEPYELKRVTLAILGTMENERFSRGISRLPMINCDTYFLTSEQVNNILGINQAGETKNFQITDECNPDKAFLDLDKLLGRHTAILGTTGSGKSCTVASIIQAILRDYPFPRILFFDLHNEYPAAFGFGSEEHQYYSSKTKCTGWDSFSLPYWFLELDEFIGIYYQGAGTAQIAIIKKEIVELKKEKVNSSDILIDRVSADSPIFFDIDVLIHRIKEQEKELNGSKKDPLTKIINRLEGIVHDSRYDFLQKDKGL